MRVIKWEPFRDVDDVFDRFFAESMRHWPRAATANRAAQEWAPAADVSETEAEYLIKADLPDVRKEDVKVLFDEGVLTIKGERKVEKEVKGGESILVNVPYVREAAVTVFLGGEFVWQDRYRP